MRRNGPREQWGREREHEARRLEKRRSLTTGLLLLAGLVVAAVIVLVTFLSGL